MLPINLLLPDELLLLTTEVLIALPDRPTFLSNGDKLVLDSQSESYGRVPVLLSFVSRLVFFIF